MTGARLHVLIVEDEEPARRTLRDLVARRTDVRCVGEAWGRGALDEIRALQPDIVLTDVRMPGMSGLEVLRALQRELGDDMPVVVVTTAYEDHALEAFDVRAVDYVLKPFTDERFDRALDRAVRTVRLLRGGLGPPSAGGSRVDPGARSTRSTDSRLVLRDGGNTVVVPLQEVRWIEASGPYVTVHAADEHVVRRSIGSLEEELRDAGFARVHRSALVRLGAVRAVRSLGHGDAVAVLDDGSTVRVSRSRREAFEARL